MPKEKRAKQTPFTAEIDEVSAFYLRADLLREMFGHWDSMDPVSHAILDIVEAQREFNDAVCPEVSGDRGGKAAINAAHAKRLAAGKKFMRALKNRESWPDPELGLRGDD
jgi:hypothetical protein